ncbi:hypothetical protein JFL43_03940 [Viridibacillus sp. YIM B01967]|uniref:Uncharacterized protein n=1 Tax=Viridibacillus soli TaxID=2798301 RepID=A0ABS1H3P1_9BACL|nr:hypothetical protein [Viridibacillus soli]MBK3494023.1 hypothetical protein [Viridibacillus soli]
MKIHVLMWTSILSAVSFTVCLRLLQLFSIIHWSPIGWSKKWQLFSGHIPLFKWMMLAVMLLIVAMVLFFLSEFCTAIRADLASFVLSIVVLVLLEWWMSGTVELKKLSIPIFVLLATHLRFIMETSMYHKKAENLDSRSKMPYNTGEVK